MAEQSLCVSLALQNMRGQAAAGKQVIKPPRMPQVWRHPLADELGYAVQIGRVVGEFVAIVNTELLRYPTWARQDGLKVDAFADEWDKVMKALRDHQKKTFEQGDGAATYAMVSNFGQNAAEFNFKEWSKQLSALAGQPYYPAHEGWVSQSVATWSDLNFELIRSLTDDYIKKVNTTVVNAVTEGTNYRDLTKQIMAVNQNMTRARAKLIARDQIGKLNGTLTKRRQSDAGVEDYTWKTANDERVRSRHKNMQGETCEWKDASKVKVGQAWADRSATTMPSGHPGYEIQCRCYATPNMDEIWKEAEDIARAEGWYPGEDTTLPPLTVKPKLVAPPPVAPPPVQPVAQKPVPNGFPTAAPGTKMPPDYYPSKGLNQVVEYSKKTKLYYRTTSTGRRTHVWNQATGTWNELGVVPGTAVPAPPVAVPKALPIVPAPVAVPAAPVGPKVTFFEADNAVAFKDAPADIAKAIWKTEVSFKGTLPPETGSKGAYYSPVLKRIHMGNGLKQGTLDYEGTWRHEFGHHLDFVMDPSGQASRKMFPVAKSRKAFETRSAKAAKEAQKAQTAEQVATLKEKNAKAAGFEKAEDLRRFFREMKIGGSEAAGLSHADKVLLGDLNDWTKSMPSSYVSRDWSRFVDMVCAIYKGDRAWGHRASYFRRKGKPETELFAQFTSLLSGPDQKKWRPTLKLFFPDMLENYEAAVKAYAGA